MLTDDPFIVADGKVADKRNNASNKDVKSRKKTQSGRRREESTNSSSHQSSRRARSPQNNPYDADESDSEEVPSGYHQASIRVYFQCTYFYTLYLDSHQKIAL